MVKEAKMIPVDIEGHVLPVLTEKQKARKIEIEYERLMKTANKAAWKSWTREEKHMMIQWAFGYNFDTSISEFKHIVEMFINLNRQRDHHIIRSTVHASGGRCLDIWCMNCGRIHTFRVPLIKRGTWKVLLPCINENENENENVDENSELDTQDQDGFTNIKDKTELKIWEIKAVKKLEAKNQNEKWDIYSGSTYSDGTVIGLNSY